MPGLTLPDLDGLAGTRDGVLGAFDNIAAALPVDSASVTAGLTGSTATLNVSLQLDGTAVTGGLSGALEALQATVPGGVPAIDGLGVGLAQALGAIEPIKQTLASGGELLDIRAFAFEHAGDPAERVAELLGQLGELIPSDGLEALQTFVSTVTAFEASIPTDPEQVATFIGRGFLGVPADLLVPARSALDDVLGQLGGLVSRAQLDALPGLAASLVAELDGLQVQVTAIAPGDPASYTATLNALASFQANLEAFAATVSSLAAGLESGIESLDAGALLGPIAAALEAIPDLQVPDTNAFVEIVLEPLRRVSALADTATPEQVAAQLRGWSGFIEREFAAQGAADLDAIIRRPFEEIGSAIEGLHLESIREAFGDALAAVTSGIASVTGAIETLREAVVGALAAATAAIDALTAATGPLQDALQTLTSAVEAAAGAVSLPELRDDALVVIQELSGGVAGFVESASAAVGTLHHLVAELGEVDLERSASGAIDLVQGITDTLSAIDVAPLPDALLDELRSALNALLGSISLEPLKGTLDGVIDAVPFEELASVSAGFDDLVGELEQFSPSGLLEPLVAPFNEVVAKLTELRPGELLDPVVEQLEAARMALDGFEPAALLAPLDGPLREVRTALEAIAPQVLFAPLHGPFDELMGLVERLDARPFLDELDTLMFEWMEEGLSGLAGLGEPFEGAAGTRSFVDQISGTGAIGGDFGFRPGDVLRPVQDLYEKITGLLETVPAAALVAGFEEIRAGLVATLDALSPTSLQESLQRELGELTGSLDLGVDSDLLGDLLPRYATLTLAVDGIDPAAVGDGARSEHTQLLTLTASADPQAVLAPVRTTLGSLRRASLVVAGSLEVRGIGSHHGAVDARLSQLLPAFLREPVTIEAIRAHLDANNPKHLAAAVNAEFEALVAKILRFAEVFAAELPQVVATLGDRMEHALSGMLRGAFSAVYEPLRTQLETLDPAGLEAELDAQVYAPIRALLDSLSVEAILGEAQVPQKLDAAKAGLDGVLEGLRELDETVGATYDTAIENVVSVSPATLQADLQNAYAPIAAALAGLDLGALSAELEAQLERLAGQIGTVLEQVLAALEAMVAAIPDGIEGVDAQVDIRVGA